MFLQHTWMYGSMIPLPGNQHWPIMDYIVESYVDIDYDCVLVLQGPACCTNVDVAE